MAVRLTDDVRELLVDALNEYVGNGDFLCYHPCEGPNTDGSHRCGRCRILAKTVIASAKFLGDDELADEWREELAIWSSKDEVVDDGS